jgi:LacI family transcriptional regulator
LRRRNRPTATVCASDTQAIGVLEAASALGLAVPDDLSVVGYDDIEAAEYIGLTTIHQPLGESGRQAARMLLDEMAEPHLGPRRTDLPVDLVVRRTTGSVPRDVTGIASSAIDAFGGVAT